MNSAAAVKKLGKNKAEVKKSVVGIKPGGQKIRAIVQVKNKGQATSPRAMVTQWREMNRMREWES